MFCIVLFLMYSLLMPQTRPCCPWLAQAATPTRQEGCEHCLQVCPDLTRAQEQTACGPWRSHGEHGVDPQPLGGGACLLCTVSLRPAQGQAHSRGPGRLLMTW